MHMSAMPSQLRRMDCPCHTAVRCLHADCLWHHVVRNFVVLTHLY
jgi:hypothetical protein